MQRTVFIMEVWESIFEAYCDGQLCVPPTHSNRTRHNLEDFVNAFKLTSAQQEQLASLINEFSCDLGRYSFYAGLKIGLRLNSEIFY